MVEKDFEGEREAFPGPYRSLIDRLGDSVLQANFLNLKSTLIPPMSTCRGAEFRQTLVRLHPSPLRPLYVSTYLNIFFLSFHVPRIQIQRHDQTVEDYVNNTPGFETYSSLLDTNYGPLNSFDLMFDLLGYIIQLSANPSSLREYVKSFDASHHVKFRVSFQKLKKYQSFPVNI